MDELWFSILTYEKESPWQQAKETALASSRGLLLFSFGSYTPSVSRGAQTHAEKTLIKWEFLLDKRSLLWYSIILPCRILSLSLEGRRDQGQGEQLNNVIRQACKDLSKNTPVRAWKGLPMYCSSETVTYQAKRTTEWPAGWLLLTPAKYARTSRKGASVPRGEKNDRGERVRGGTPSRSNGAATHRDRGWKKYWVDRYVWPFPWPNYGGVFLKTSKGKYSRRNSENTIYKKFTKQTGRFGPSRELPMEGFLLWRA